MTAWRIGDGEGRDPVWSAEGARQVSGRWHEAGAEVIHASRCYSTAMLEKLVYWNGRVPRNQHFIRVSVPPGTSYEIVTPDILPDWHRRDCEAARRFGRAWYEEKRSAILIVPSVVARMEHNLVINVRHPHFERLEAGLEIPIWWDERLFRRSDPGKP